MCEVKQEIKTDLCLTHHCLTVSIMNCLRLRKYLLHEITSLLSSADVKNAWRYTSNLVCFHIFFNYVNFFTFRFHL